MRPLTIAATLLFLSACGGTASQRCVPGEQQACACPGGPQQGAQACVADGSGFSTCEGCSVTAVAPDMAANDDMSAVAVDEGVHDLAAPDTDLAQAKDMAVAADMTLLRDFATVDLAMPDLATPDFGGVICGGMTCTTGQACCSSTNGATNVCAAENGCGDAGVVLDCDGPEDCNGNACCATLVASGQTPTADSACSGGATSCAAGNIDFTNETITTKLCHSPADCADYQGNFGAFSSCCSFAGMAYKFCAPPVANGSMGITCAM